MDPFIGEIRIFGGNFAPRGWAFCNGQIMAIAQNSALFALLGVTYGGDGRTTFALPNLQGRFPMYQGAGPGLTPRVLGETGGTASVSLQQQEIPAHQHGMNAAPSATTGTPGPTVALSPVGSGASAYRQPGNRVAMDSLAVVPAGGGAPHNNVQPYLALNFIIALEGIFPPRS